MGYVLSLRLSTVWFFLYMYTADCTNTCKNGGVVTKGSSGCSCKCPSGLKGSDCSELDTSDGMFKVHGE